VERNLQGKKKERSEVRICGGGPYFNSRGRVGSDKKKIREQISSETIGRGKGCTELRKGKKEYLRSTKISKTEKYD